jgi:hypothetical protein
MPENITVKPKQSWNSGCIFIVCYLIVGIICVWVLIEMFSPVKDPQPHSFRSTFFPFSIPAPQPQGRCDDSFDQDDLGIYNFGQSPKDRVVVNPGSKTKLCYGSLVSIPEDRWKTWGAQFVKPAGQKERCVAYFSYIYPDQHVITLGPRYEQELGIGNMSGAWRVATNCPIEYYRW